MQFRWKIDWFLVGMVAAVGLAALFPDPGAEGGVLHPELLTKIGVALIFFLQGISLSFAALRAGTLRWPVHVLVQACTFLLFPLLGIVLLWVVGNRVPPDLRIGLFFLCALPSTVSSSVAMTAAARGNVPVAVFNATLSSLLGVFLTPLWISWVLQSSSVQVPFGSVILDLMLWLVLPLVVGQVLRPWLGGWAARHKRFTQRVDRGTILLLVYTSFCDSMKRGVWSNNGLGIVLLTVAIAAMLFTVVLLIMQRVGTALRLPTGDRIAAVFCGSKKTLASGVPMAQLIFGTTPGLGLILLPIMIYHPLQLVICGVLAGRWAAQADSVAAAPAPASAD